MITIEFSFAWLFFIMMVVGFICVVCGMGVFKGELIALGVILIFCGDGACALGSGYYMSHPTNGYRFYDNNWDHICKEYNYTIHSFENPQPCIMPTPQDNPYEKQPLHPIKWIIEFIWESMKLATGAVQFKVT